MSAETESIILGVIALLAGVGTAVAIRKKTARIAVCFCIVGGAVMLLYGGLDRESKRRTERDFDLRERQERLRATLTGDASADQPQSLVVLPNGTVVRSNASNAEQYDGAGVSGDLQRNKASRPASRDGVGIGGDDSSRGRGRRRFPTIQIEDPKQQPTRESKAAPNEPAEER